MDIEGMSVKTAQRLVEEGLVSELDDLYRLTAEQLVALERFAEISVDNLLAAIKRTRQQPLWRVIVALEIPQVGSQTAKLLAREFHDLDQLAAAGRERLEAVHGIGPLMAQEIVAWFADERNRELVARLAAVGLATCEDEASGAPLPLEGRSLVLTGTLSFVTRGQLTEWLELNGATVSGSVSKRTWRLIAGEAPGSKLAKAAKLGVTVWDERQLVEFMHSRSFIPEPKPPWWPRPDD
jgi:DNA ligase (NAD+)